MGSCPDILGYSSSVYSQPEGIMFRTPAGRGFGAAASSKNQVALLHSNNDFLNVIIFNSQTL